MRKLSSGGNSGQDPCRALLNISIIAVTESEQFGVAGNHHQKVIQVVRRAADDVRKIGGVSWKGLRFVILAHKIVPQFKYVLLLTQRYNKSGASAVRS